MTYLTAYRSQSRKYGGEQGKAFKLPEPYKPNTSPPAVNDNIPKVANDNVRKAAARRLALKGSSRVLARAVPYLGWALTAYDLWRLMHSLQSKGITMNLAGWVQQNGCGQNGPPTHVNYSAGFGPGAFAGCFVNTSVPGTDPATTVPTTGQGRALFFRYTHNVGTQERGNTHSAWYRPSASGLQKPLQVRHLPTAPTRPVLDPTLLPISYPMPLPIPLPMPLVLARANDPIGSQRTNGDRSPSFRLRRPPPSGKERKIKALPNFIHIIRAVWHGTTEGLDALDAVHDALPKEYRAKAFFKGGKWWNPTPQAKAEAIYKNFEHLDMNEAVKNLIVNHFTDELVGRALGKAKRGLDKTGAHGGGAVFNPGGWTAGLI